MNLNKKKVHDFWNKSSCGEDLYLIEESKNGYNNQSNSRYKLEGDLLESNVGQRHRGLLLTVAKGVYPRWLIRLVMPNSGLFMLIKLRK